MNRKKSEKMKKLIQKIIWILKKEKNNINKEKQIIKEEELRKNDEDKKYNKEK